MAMQGNELKALRKEAGLTQGELATAIGMTGTSIGLMERGAANIEPRTELAVRRRADDVGHGLAHLQGIGEGDVVERARTPGQPGADRIHATPVGSGRRVEWRQLLAHTRNLHL